MLKIYACYSASHAAFVHRHFLPSIPEGLEVILHKMPQDCEGGAFRSAKWGEMAKRKFEMCIAACVDPEADLVYVSDVDARFYTLTAEALERDLEACLGTSSIAFQWDGEGKFCSGSWVARPSDDLADMFRRATTLLPKHKGYDQPAMNEALTEFEGTIKARRLPDRYWSHGASTGIHWEPGMQVRPPEDLILHQANWCIGQANKLALLEAVRYTMLSKMTTAGTEQPPLSTLSDPSMIVGHVPEAFAQTRVPLIIETPEEITKAPRLVRSPKAEAMERADGHPVNAPALVLQFWEGDKRQACELAELIADIEPKPRRDVLFIFAPQKGTVIDAQVERAMAHVGLKFGYKQITTDVDVRKSYPGICFDPWKSAVDQLAKMHFNDELRSPSAFLFEPDGCPASVDWIDRLTEAHQFALDAGKWFTGAVMLGDHYDRHMNGSFIMYLPIWPNFPNLHTCPADQAWDIWHGPTILAHGCDTRRIVNAYDLSYTEGNFARLGREAAWFSSNKDRTAHLWARRLLVKS